MFEKFFTPQEANQKLPVVKKIVGEILEKGKLLRGFLQDHQESAGRDAEALGKEIEGLIARLEEIGCFYKDWNFEIGLVDFPCMVDGEEAFLCWRSDEGEILWYHSLHDGYAGRRPLPAEWLLKDVF